MGILARLTSDPRHPGSSRVPYSPRTLAGVAITADTAVTVPAVWAALRYLSQTVAVLPWNVVRKTKNGNEIVPTHFVDYLLDEESSAEWPAFAFRETLTHWAIRWGNGYAEIERDQTGRAFALWPIHPERVHVCRDPDTGALYYDVMNVNTADASAGRVRVDAADMFHIKGFGEGPVGVNVTAYAAQSIGWARAAQLFGASFFGNGMNVSGVVTNKKPLDPKGLKRQKAEFAQLYQGPRNANKTAFLDNDATWQQITVDANKSQFIETNQFLVADMCRWIGVPPHKVYDLVRSTNNNIEHQSIEVVVDSIVPWVKRFEQEANRKLFGAQNRQGLKTKMTLNALMRGDVAARGTWYKTMREVAAFSINDILKLEDMNTIGPQGDIRVMNGTYRTLEQVIAGVGDPAAAPKSPPGAPAEPSQSDAAAKNRIRHRAAKLQKVAA